MSDLVKDLFLEIDKIKTKSNTKSELSKHDFTVLSLASLMEEEQNED